MRKIFIAVLCLAILHTNAQHGGVNGPKDEGWKKIYRAFPTKINDLVHTKLDVRFDYQRSYLLGKVRITIKPHFYPTDSLQLDAKGMNINAVAIVKNGRNVLLKYTYDSSVLNIKLDKTYRNNENYTIYIDYVAKPNELKSSGSKAITGAKGLYFINPKGEEKDKPTQIWTQGETEATSVWVPTIDKPNQKTTQEISMTVPAKYVTLSNGKLISQKKNADGTRTDNWKMDQPHAPYLLFMGVGDFAIVKDTYKGKEVSYYVEKEYEKVARKIFGMTPEMIQFFEKILGVPYPWAKYSQMVARDYVSGAMENTTATLHQETAQQNARQLVDENKWEDVISHELFHQWFGDLVTTESWSNLTVNESFANYSEYLWREYKYGKDHADALHMADMQGYLASGSANKDLVRFYYSDKEDMFDAVSYNKGGRILHMLRNFVGDSAFFKSLNLYLTRNRFGTGNAHKLRLAFEEVTGRDLNWFFNQWYFGSGHPNLDISYAYDEASGTAKVFVRQTQQGDKVFKLPFAIDIYNGADKTRHTVWMNNKADTFSFSVPKKPDLINVDAEKVLLGNKKDAKTLAEYAHQYRYAKSYLDRREALDFAIKNKNEAVAAALISDALNDKYHGLRSQALSGLTDSGMNAATLAKVENIATNDTNRLVRAHAIAVLGNLKNDKYKPLFLQNITDSSYSVAGAALLALMEIDEAAAIAALPELKKDAKANLKAAVEQVAVLTKTDADFEEMTKDFEDASMFDKFSKFNTYIAYLSRVENTANFKKGVDLIVTFRNQVAPFAPQFKDVVNKLLTDLKEKKQARKTKSSNPSAIDEQVAYLDTVIK